MKRVLNILLGLVWLPLGAFFGVVGFLRFYRHATVMADGNLSPDASGQALLQMLLGLLLVAVAYWALKSGIARLKRGFQGEGAPAEETRPAAPPPTAAPAPVQPVEPVLALAHGSQVVHLSKSGGDAVLGRGAGSTVAVASRFVSRAHARIEWTESGLPVLVNLGASGTSLLRDDEAQPRVCDPSLLLQGAGTIALYADYADAAGRGDTIRYELF